MGISNCKCLFLKGRGEGRHGYVSSLLRSAGELVHVNQVEIKPLVFEDSVPPSSGPPNEGIAFET